MEKYRVFTIKNGKVIAGAAIEIFKIKGSGIEVPAVMVGEEGRGRKLGVMTISGLEENHSHLMFAEIGQTKAGKPKFISRNQETTNEKIVVVFKTHIGFRGGNSHTGDRNGEEEHEDWGVKKTRPTFAPFPGEIIVRGCIAQGEAGAMGNGEQLIALISKDTVFRTAYSGRLYGAPSSHYYKWNGTELLSATWEERTTTDLF